VEGALVKEKKERGTGNLPEELRNLKKDGGFERGRTRGAQPEKTKGTEESHLPEKRKRAQKRVSRAFQKKNIVGGTRKRMMSGGRRDRSKPGEKKFGKRKVHILTIEPSRSKGYARTITCRGRTI